MYAEYERCAKILGISPSTNIKDIKKVYKKLVLIHHPDKFKNPENKIKAEENFKKINNAYHFLMENYLIIGEGFRSGYFYKGFYKNENTQTSNNQKQNKQQQKKQNKKENTYQHNGRSRRQSRYFTFDEEDEDDEFYDFNDSNEFDDDEYYYDNNDNINYNENFRENNYDNKQEGIIYYERRHMPLEMKIITIIVFNVLALFIISFI